MKGPEVFVWRLFAERQFFVVGWVEGYVDGDAAAREEHTATCRGTENPQEQDEGLKEEGARKRNKGNSNYN